MGFLRALGLMSGTSMDGIDVALVETDGVTIRARGPSLAVDYDPGFRQKLAACLDAATQMTTRSERPGTMAEVERELTERHARAVSAFFDRHGVDSASIDILGFHGQTVLHRPERALTVQIGDGSELAKLTGVPVVYDMRANDMLHGGQGAPLVPAYHVALAAGLPRDLEPGFGPVVFVNIGGIANITLIAPGRPPVAFDCGPGNALLDQWVEQHAGIPYDDGGRISAEGSVDERVLSRYLAAPFFRRSGPKSLDRGDFSLDPLAGMELSDGAATLVRLTAISILKAAEHMPEAPRLWIVSGGGARNDAIMDAMREAAGEGANIVTAFDAGFSGDMMEAEAWGFLAVRSVRKLSLSFPSTTGCMFSVTGGLRADP